MFYLYAFLASIVSPLIWVLNAEGFAVLGGLVGGRPWPLVALVLTAGQVITFTLLYVSGRRLAPRWKGLRRRIERLEADPARFERYRRFTLGWVFVAAVFGMPPAFAMSALCPVLGVRYRPFLAAIVAGRYLRFSLLAGVPALFSEYFPLDALPDWLRALA